MGKEAKIEGKVCDFAESLGFEHRKLAWIGRKDAPDRIFWRPEGAHRACAPFVIEFKDLGCVPRGGQLRELDSLQRAGMAVYVVDTIDEGKEILLRHARLC